MLHILKHKIWNQSNTFHIRCRFARHNLVMKHNCCIDFKVIKNAVKVHCCYLPRKCWRSRYPTETA